MGLLVKFRKQTVVYLLLCMVLSIISDHSEYMSKNILLRHGPANEHVSMPES